MLPPGPSPGLREEELAGSSSGPGPQTLPAVTPKGEIGSQPNRPSDSSGSHIVEASPEGCMLCLRCEVAEAGTGKEKAPPQGLSLGQRAALARARSPAEHSPQPVSWAAPAHLLALGQVNPEGPQEERWVWALTSLSS